MSFDPESLTQDKLHEYRKAAEAAWSDETRHPQFVGHPQPAAGQCYVTSRWLQSHLGGNVGVKNGHYIWVSEDHKYVVDLTGDQFAYEPSDPQFEGVLHDEEDEPWTYDEHHRTWRPGPILYKRGNHPLFKGFRVKEFTTENPRVKLFKQRADAALEGKLQKSADFGWGGDSHPAEEPEARDRYHHDFPDNEPYEDTYNFFFGGGKLHLSPEKGHNELRQIAQVAEDYAGPTAVGTVTIKNGTATFNVMSNMAVSALERVFEDYSDKAGWVFGGVSDLAEQKLAHRLYYHYDKNEDHLYLSHVPISAHRGDPDSGLIRIVGQTASIHGSAHPSAVDALDQWADDYGYRFAGDTLLKRHEDLELDNIYDPKGDDYSYPQTDDSKPEGPLKCPECDQEFPHWNEYVWHRKEHQRQYTDPDIDGKFPELDMDKSLQPHFHDREPFVFPLASVQRVQLDDHLDKLWNIGSDTVHFAAYLNGEQVGAASVNRVGNIDALTALRHSESVYPALLRTAARYFPTLTFAGEDQRMIRRLERYGFVMAADGPYIKWAADKLPRDQIEAPVPFIYDIEKDDIFTGHPGARTSDIVGNFAPGGIVEGYYEPGGKVVITTMTDMPYTTRHMLDLWYWTHPHMEITSVEVEDQGQGNRTKLAATDVGSYIKTLAMADPAVWRSYKALKEAGGEVYVVGGAVRDALLNREPKDIDLLVRGVDAETVNHVLNKLPGRVDLTGKDFGVYRYRTKGHEVEIALPRTERSTGDRRVDFDVSVDHTMPVEDDLLRRDFTVNAMAVSLDNGRLVDPYGGAQDIESRTLRTVHPSSFVEDPTRLVRALVATSKHGIMPDERTRKEMVESADRLDLESKDRLYAELDKLFGSKNPARALRLAQDTGILAHLFPEIAEHWDFNQRNPHHTHSLGEHLLSVLEGVQEKTDDPDLRMAAFLHDIGKPDSQWIDDDGVGHYYKHPDTGEGQDHETVGARMAGERLKTLRWPKARIQRITDLIQHHMFPAFSSPKGARKFLNRVGDHHADDLLVLRHADMYGKGTDDYQDKKTPVHEMQSLVDNARLVKAPTDISQLAINGNDLMTNLGLTPGPQVGTILRQLTDHVLESPEDNDPQKLMELAQGMV